VRRVGYGVLPRNASVNQILNSLRPLCHCLIRKNYYLLSDLRGGAHGRVWLACNRNGKTCVVKFAKNDQNNQGEEILNTELNMWNLLWDPRVRISFLGNQRALIMPYVYPCTEEDWKLQDVRQAAEEAVTVIANKYFKHNDLNRRHVGLYKLKEITKAVLFDLADVSPITDCEKAKREMLQDLFKS